MIGILGTGPAALLAAHAATRHGRIPLIYGRVPTDLRPGLLGAQFVTRPVPGLEFVPKEQMSFERNDGWDIDAYRAKLSQSDEPLDEHPDRSLMTSGMAASVSSAMPVHAYDLRVIYWSLLHHYRPALQPLPFALTWRTFETLQSAHPEITRWVSTEPGPAMCSEPHTFASVNVWRAYLPTAGEAPLVRWSSDESRSWTSIVDAFGESTVEWPHTQLRPPAAHQVVPRAISNNCTCHREVLRVGLAAWDSLQTISGVYGRVAAFLRDDIPASEGIAHFASCPLVRDDITFDVAQQMGCRCGA